MKELITIKHTDMRFASFDMNIMCTNVLTKLKHITSEVLNTNGTDSTTSCDILNKRDMILYKIISISLANII